jgi:nucleotide-binding universal stress UspA family protein
MKEAQEAQLVVVGSHGHSSFMGMVLGSTSHALLHHSPCSVAVIRPHNKEEKTDNS